jgi:RHS repeat-associated protein
VDGLFCQASGGYISQNKIAFAGGTSVVERSAADNAVTVKYARGSDLGGGVGGILYTMRPVSGGLTVSYTHANHRGDIIMKTKANGVASYQASYSGYGTRMDEEGGTPDAQKANSKDEDPTGLLNEGFRYRDLAMNVFLTRDPAGFVDGPNLYTYVRQNPWTKFDPRGLRAQNENEKKGLQAMRDVEKRVRSEAKTYSDEASRARTAGDLSGAISAGNSAKRETERADGIVTAITQIEKMIADSPSQAKDPRQLKTLNSAFEKWMDPKLQQSYSFPNKGGSRTGSTFMNQNKCNVFLFDCLVQSGFSSSSLMHPGTKNPALAGKWNDPNFNPAGLGVRDVQLYDPATEQWSSPTGGSPHLQPGEVATYGAAGASANSAHATISLGGGWLINASDSPVYGQPGGVNIKPDSIAGEAYGQRTIRTP